MRGRPAIGVVVALVAAGAVGTAGGSAAGATTGGSTVLAGYQASFGTVARAATSTTTAGDVASMSVNVPTVTCPQSGTTGLSEILNVLGSGGSAFADVFVFCSNGSVTYTGAISASGSEGGVDWNDSRLITVSAGDTLKYTIDAGSSSSKMSIKDLTSGASASLTGLGITPTAIQVGTQPYFDPSTNAAAPVPVFTAIHYGSITYNGSPLSSLNPSATNLVDGSGYIEIRTGSLNSAGNRFTTTFVSST